VSPSDPATPKTAAELFAASEQQRPDPAGWGRIGTAAARVLADEERLWEQLSG